MTNDESAKVTPISAEGQETTELQKLWQDYLQKCCELGQLYNGKSKLEDSIRHKKTQVDYAGKKFEEKRDKDAASGKVDLSTPDTPTTTSVQAQESVSH
jgi:hypothetical protein